MVSLRALKRSFYRRKPYERELRVQSGEHGPFELATVNPRTQRVTNRWAVAELLDVLTGARALWHFEALATQWL